MKITIDGAVLDANPGQTVLEVARANGIYVPSLCWHPRLGKAGRCRACLVAVEGMPSLKEACALEVKPGMKVETRTERVLAARRMVVELLLAGNCHNCISCEANGDCELQDMAYSLGIDHPAFSAAERPIPLDESSEGIVRDLDRCIQCGRCVTACNNTVMNEVLDFGYRGSHARLICDDDVPMGQSTCVQCGECVQVCPVGALTFKLARGKARTWETRTTKVTCPYCGVGCQIDLVTKDNQVVGAYGHEHRWREQPNQGMLCVKGRFGLDFVNSPERLRQPLIRKDGKLTPCSWDEALDFTASKLTSIKAAHGPNAIGFLCSAKVTNEENYAMARLARAAIGTNNIDHCARL
jgi:predicted molibdopterin-dependent oxidoreductase YjgC